MSSASNAVVKDEKPSPSPDSEPAPSPSEPAGPSRGKAVLSAKPHLMWAWRTLGIPLVAIALFLLVWSRLSAGIETSLGTIPGPTAVAAQVKVLWADHLAEREKRAAF